VKGRFETEVAAFSFDLGPPIDEARALLRASIGPARAAPVLAGLETLRPLDVRAEPDGINVRVALDVPAPGPPSSPEPPLAPLELGQWRAALERWDAFLVFMIKDLGVLDQSRDIRDQLLELLLSGRHALLEALAAAPEAGVDPVRQLFLDAWEQFRSIARQAAAHGALQDHATRYLTFLTAGDALAALDAAAPWLGLEISADGLRRLARVLEPDYLGDPLAYSEGADAALRELFDFHEPTSSEPAQPDAGWWPRLGTAWATASPSGQLTNIIARRLDRWVPGQEELGEYRDAVARLLAAVSARTAEVNAIEQRFRALYDDLVRTTAWQESCWRQFVRRDGEVTYLLSPSGDIGMMQVNRRVWRGFFDLQKLEWDVAYNAGAGAEILAQLLGRYGVREAGRLENAARATYAAYNGGPGAYRRYRLNRVPRRLRAIDRAFWEKFRAMAAGQALDYVLCVATWKSSRARLSIAPSGSTPK
jgi:soluble lytic murein transglycosylase-like protein